VAGAASRRPGDGYLDWIQNLPRKILPDNLTLGFCACLFFFTGVLSLELMSGESWGIPAKKAVQPTKYWIVLHCQAALAIILVAAFYFLTH
jgi:hypothetical protein